MKCTTGFSPAAANMAGGGIQSTTAAVLLPQCCLLVVHQQQLVIACLQRSLPKLPQLGMPAVCCTHNCCCACAAVVHVLANSAAAPCHCLPAAQPPHVATAGYARSMFIQRLRMRCRRARSC
jgi:hypothetical protein